MQRHVAQSLLHVPHCILTGGTAALGSGFQTLSWTTAVYNRDGMFDAGAPTVMTVQVDGIYVITGYCTFAPDSTQYREIDIRHTGGTPIGSCVQLFPPSAVAGVSTLASACAVVRAKKGDQFFIRITHNISSLNVTANAFMATWVGPY